MSKLDGRAENPHTTGWYRGDKAATESKAETAAMNVPPSDPGLAALLEADKSRVITDEEKQAQRESWVRGEMGLDRNESKAERACPACQSQMKEYRLCLNCHSAHLLNLHTSHECERRGEKSICTDLWHFSKTEPLQPSVREQTELEDAASEIAELFSLSRFAEHKIHEIINKHIGTSITSARIEEIAAEYSDKSQMSVEESLVAAIEKALREAGVRVE